MPSRITKTIDTVLAVPSVVLLVDTLVSPQIFGESLLVGKLEKPSDLMWLAVEYVASMTTMTYYGLRLAYEVSERQVKKAEQDLVQYYQKVFADQNK